MISLFVEVNSSRDNVNLARSCRALCHRVLPWLYKEDVLRKHGAGSRRGWPYIASPPALYWACRHGSLGAATASLAAIDELAHLGTVKKSFILRDAYSCTAAPWSRHITYETDFLSNKVRCNYGLEGATLMHVACAGGHSAILELLASHGAPLDCLDACGHSLFAYCLSPAMVSNHSHLSAGLS